MRMDRIQKVTENMKMRGIDQFFITSEASLFYLTEHWVHPMERFLALYLSTDGNCVYIANDFFYLSETIDCPVIRYKDGQDPMKVLRQFLKDTGEIGVEASMPASFLLKIQKQLKRAKMREASECIQQVRMIKDPQEIEKLRQSSEINDKAIEKLISKIHAGCTEEEISHQAPEIYCGYGAKGYHSCPIVAFGNNAADPHHGADSSKIKPGDSIVIDTGSIFQDYCSDMTRTVFFQKASPELTKVYQIVKEAQEYACSVIRPGIPCCEIDRAARNVIEAAGYGHYFTHRLGHGIGLEGHEAPEIGGSNPIPVKEGMVFSIEPGIYIPGKGGVRIEDLIVVTGDGCEILNDYTKDLTIL